MLQSSNGNGTTSGARQMKTPVQGSSSFALVGLMLIALAACGGGGGGSHAPTTYTIGGTVTGLTGTGLVLQNNASGDLAVSAAGAFTFATGLATGATYAVSVKTQPSSPTQNCVVTAGFGTVAKSNVTNVAVACTTTYTIGGTVTGLTGTGLVLQNNAGGDLSVSAAGAFTFATRLATGAAYAVTVKTQPSSPMQNCVVTTGSGTVATSNVTNVAVACTTATFTIGGVVSELSRVGPRSAE